MSFLSAPIFAQIGAALNAMSPEERAKQISKVAGVFAFEIKKGKEVKKCVCSFPRFLFPKLTAMRRFRWYIDLKKEGKVGEGDKPDADVTIQVRSHVTPGRPWTEQRTGKDPETRRICF